MMKEASAYLSDPIIYLDVIQLVMSEWENDREILTSTTPNIIFQNVAILYEP